MEVEGDLQDIDSFVVDVVVGLVKEEEEVVWVADAVVIVGVVSDSVVIILASVVTVLGVDVVVLDDGGGALVEFPMRGKPIEKKFKCLITYGFCHLNVSDSD